MKILFYMNYILMCLRIHGIAIWFDLIEEFLH
jgi:hypothetical protein